MPVYPEIEPHASGLLDVGDGNQIHWETSGNPDGAAAAHPMPATPRLTWPTTRLIT